MCKTTQGLDVRGVVPRGREEAFWVLGCFNFGLKFTKLWHRDGHFLCFNSETVNSLRK